LLAQALVQDPHNEGAWMLMSEVVDEVRLKRNCLQRVLLINPNNEAANNALMRLDTSPLGPVMRGERYKPVIPPKDDKTPPFTPPFTWTGDDAQFQALDDMVYPDLTGEQVNQIPEPPTKFDWAHESPEPDKTIEQIFDKVSNPEKALQPVPDTDLDWLVAETGGETADQGLTEQEKEARLLDELVGTTVAAAVAQPPASTESSPVVPEKLTGEESTAPEESTEPDSILWDNPKAKKDRLVILGVSSIIFASPAAADIPHIMGLFNEKKMLRDLLGKSARTIRFESIECLTANPVKSELGIKYLQNEKSAKHKLKFSSPQVRDEALSALEQRLGEEFSHQTRITNIKDKLLPPVIGILIIAAVIWFLIAGLPLLSQLIAFQSGLLELILYNIQYYVDLVGAFNILMIGLILAILCLVWMVINLSKPAKLIFIERKSSQKP
jgi:hypothetical protein